MIDGVIQTPLKQIKDERGKVMHMLRSTDPHFEAFGEVYFSWINPGIIKAWKMHKEMTMNFAVPCGKIKLVLYDGRVHSKTFGEINEFLMSDEDYYLLTIPNELWYGFSCESNESAMIVNCATIPHTPQESVLKDIEDSSIPYLWK